MCIRDRLRKDERLSWPSWLTYSGWFTHKWSPISYRSCARQRKHAGQRPMLYRWTTQPTNGRLANEQVIKFLWRYESPSGYRDCLSDSSLWEIRKVVNGRSLILIRQMGGSGYYDLHVHVRAELEPIRQMAGLISRNW